MAACHGRHEMPQQREAIVLAQRFASISAQAGGDKKLMVMIEERVFHSAAALGIPVRRYHVGKVVRCQTYAPIIPVEEPDVAAAVSGGSNPDMGVAVNDREIAARREPRERWGAEAMKRS